MNLHRLFHRYAPWFCPYCGAKWVTLLLVCGCASTQESQPPKLPFFESAAMAPLPVMTLAQAQAVSPPAGESMMVTFDPSPSVGVAGYKIYYGNSINNLVSFVDIGNVTTATVQTGLQYPIHLAATAYDTNGNESVFSNFAGVLGTEAHDVIYAQTNSDLAMGAWNDAFLVLQATNSQPNFYRLRINRNIQHVTYP